MSDLAALFTSHRAKLNEVIATRSSDRIRAGILVDLAKQARRLLASIAHDERNSVDGPFSTAGKWGPNGCGPKVDDLLSSARFHGRVRPSLTVEPAGDCNFTRHSNRKDAA
jgi:hypothetical protein